MEIPGDQTVPAAHTRHGVHPSGDVLALELRLPFDLEVFGGSHVVSSWYGHACIVCAPMQKTPAPHVCGHTCVWGRLLAAPARGCTTPYTNASRCSRACSTSRVRISATLIVYGSLSPESLSRIVRCSRLGSRPRSAEKYLVRARNSSKAGSVATLS